MLTHFNHRQKFAALSLALLTVMGFGWAAPARAEGWHHDRHHGDRRDWHHDHWGIWANSAAPPVYAPPTYYEPPPPVVYAPPAVGFSVHFGR